jgi:hypothetical protein
MCCVQCTLIEWNNNFLTACENFMKTTHIYWISPLEGLKCIRNWSWEIAWQTSTFSARVHFDYKETDSQNNSSCTRGCSITDSLHSTNKLARAPLPWAVITMSGSIILEGSHQTIYVHITCAHIVAHENVQQLYFQNTKYCCTRAAFKTTHTEHLEDCKISQLVMI